MANPTGTINADEAHSTRRLTGLPTPTVSDEAATKGYADSIAGGGGASISDTAFASSWNGVTTTAPSKNAVYDWAHTFDTDDDGKVNVLDMGAGIVQTDAGGIVSATTIGSGLTFTGGTLSATAGVTAFTGLSDVPASYTGQGSKLVSVNSGETGLVFITPTTSGVSQILTGGGVAWTGTGFNYIISAAVYLINGVQFNSAQTSVTLSAADATQDRIDIFVVDSSGTASVITGTPGTPPIQPSVDPGSQLLLTFAYVVAASSTPVITNVNLYLENTEYTMSASAGTINVASTNNPYAGTKDIEGTATANGNLFTAVKPSGTLDLSVYTQLTFQLRSKAAWPSAKSIAVFWMNGAAVVGVSQAVKDGTFGFNSSNTSSYQQIVVPIANFGTGTNLVDRLRMTVSGGGPTIGWYIDNIILQAGGGGGGGGGTVTNFSAGALAPLFTTTVATPTTTPVLSFVLSAAAAHTFLANNTGSSAVPSFTSFAAGTDYANLTFKTISVSGQSDVVADSAADTLTLAAGSNITLTTNAGTDTVTIAAAGSAQTHAVTFVVDGSGSVLGSGTKNPIKIPYGGTLTGWLLIGNPSGSVTVDIFRAANGAGLPVTSIIGGSGVKPALSGAVENSSTSFTSWTSTTLTAKDNMAISLSGVSTCTYISLTLYFS